MSLKIRKKHYKFIKKTVKLIRHMSKKDKVDFCGDKESVKKRSASMAIDKFVRSQESFEDINFQSVK